MNKILVYLLSIFLIISILLTSCNSLDSLTAPSASSPTPTTKEEEREPDLPLRSSTPIILTTVASGEDVVQSADGAATIDTSHINEGYVMVKYSGANTQPMIQIAQISDSGKPSYNYHIQDFGQFGTYPLSLGNGEYIIKVLEWVSGKDYYSILEKVVTVTIDNEFLPFLHPNAYVNFNENSKAVLKGQELAEGTYTDIEVITNIFDFVTSNIKYDDDLATKVTTNEISVYFPDIDRTLDTKKGICWDYASLMASMLRSQGIPTKLVMGHVGEVYHAWISCYTKETGWMDNIIEFDGKQWKLIDPTFYANSNGKRKSTVGDGQNYLEKFFY